MTSNSTDDLGIASHPFILLACGLCYAALGFEAWGWPAIDGYPFIERFIDAGYLTNDFYTNTAASYGVDTAQAWLFGGLERATGIRYEMALAVLNLIRCIAFPALVYALLHALSGSRQVGLTGAVLGTLAVFALPKTLGWSWIWGDTSTAMFAVPAIMLGWTHALWRQAGRALLWFALAAAIHPLTTVHGLIVLGLIALLDLTGEERRATLRSAPAWLGAIVFGAVFVAQYVMLKSNATIQLPIEEYTNIMARERHPTDFLPSQFSPESYVAFALAAAAVVLVLWRRWSEIPRRRLVLGTFAVYVVICIAGYLLVEVRPIRFFVELMPYRTANIAAPFMLLIVALVAAQQLERQRYLAFAAIAVAFILGSPYAPVLLPLDGALLRIIAAGWLLVVVAWLTWRRAERGVQGPSRGDRLLAPLLGGSRFAFTISLGLLLLAAAGAWTRKSAFVIPTVQNQHPVYGWIATNTPANAVFLADQFSTDREFLAAINPQKLRLVGRRAVVASLDFPFLDRDMRPWFARWATVLQGTTPDRIDRADVPTLLALRQTFPYDYVIRRTPLPTDPRLPLQVVFSTSRSPARVVVYRVGG